MTSKLSSTNLPLDLSDKIQQGPESDDINKALEEACDWLDEVAFHESISSQFKYKPGDRTKNGMEVALLVVEYGLDGIEKYYMDGMGRYHHVDHVD